MKRILLILAGIIIINFVFIYCSCIVSKRCDENEKRNKRKKR